MDLTHKPAILNAKFLIEVLSGEHDFTIVGDETFTTSEGKVLECLKLAYGDEEEILYKPNATAKKQFQEAGLKSSDEAIGYVLKLYTIKTLMGSDEVDAVRIKSINKPAKKGRF